MSPAPTPASDLDVLLGTADADLDRLTDRLARDAEAEGVLDVAHRTVDSPWGSLLLAATPAGVVRVAFAREGLDEVLDRLAATISPRVLAAPARLDPLARQLDEYFAHRRTAFDVDLDMRLSQGFRRAVLDRLRRVPYGATRSYAELAVEAGSPRAVRAVGTACATNPLPIVVPCHRVVRTDGTIGQYLGGTDVKRGLLELEGVRPGRR